MDDKFDIAVVGSCMVDLTCYAPRLPKTGETLCGSDFKIGFGGKGCNQCVAARKLGADCLLVARVGNDVFGKDYVNKLVEYGISTKNVKITEGISTGMAQITVADTGENQIVVVLGANSKLVESDVDEALNAIIGCKVLICQMEIPDQCTLRALQIKSDSKTGLSILNAAPAKPNMDPRLFSLPDVFCVNEIEAEIITNIKIKCLVTAESAVEELLAKGCRRVVITLGEKGAVYGEKDSAQIIHVPTLKVKAVDTTGSGDAFVGALAYFAAAHPALTMVERITEANKLAAFSVQRMGTQESFPTATYSLY